jgi:hypothetical protein
MDFEAGRQDGEKFDAVSELPGGFTDVCARSLYDIL